MSWHFLIFLMVTPGDSLRILSPSVAELQMTLMLIDDDQHAKL